MHRIFIALIAALAFVGRAVDSTTFAIAALIDLAFEHLASPERPLPRLARLSDVVDGPQLAAAGVPQHRLRHEAGTFRRSAARNI